MEQHTEGPWIIPDDGNENILGDVVSISIIDKDGFPICDLDCSPVLHNWHVKYPKMHHWADGAESGKTQRDRSQEEFAANVRLISAAPELLAALKEVKRRLDRNGISGGQLPEYGLIASAISKAEAR